MCIHWEISDISCIAVSGNSLTSGNSTLYTQCNFGTVTEHNTQQSHVVSTQTTRSIRDFDAWITFPCRKKKKIFVLFSFLFWAALILAFSSMATSLVLTPCSVCRTCVKWGEKVIFFTWQVRPQLGNVLYTEHTNQAKIPSNLHYGVVYIRKYTSHQFHYSSGMRRQTAGQDYGMR